MYTCCAGWWPGLAYTHRETQYNNKARAAKEVHIMHTEWLVHRSVCNFCFVVGDLFERVQ